MNSQIAIIENSSHFRRIHSHGVEAQGYQPVEFNSLAMYEHAMSQAEKTFQPRGVITDGLEEQCLRVIELSIKLGVPQNCILLVTGSENIGIRAKQKYSKIILRNKQQLKSTDICYHQLVGNIKSNIST